MDQRRAVLYFLLAVATLLGSNNAVESTHSKGGHLKGDLVEIDGVTYYVDVTTEYMTYFNATYECDAMGMELVKFETMEKNDRIMAALAENPAYHDVLIWTAGRAGDPDSAFWTQWYWGYNKTMGPWIREFDWAPDMPFWQVNNYASCIYFQVPPIKANWKDDLCEYTWAGFVCQPKTL